MDPVEDPFASAGAVVIVVVVVECSGVVVRDVKAHRSSVAVAEHDLARYGLDFGAAVVEAPRVRADDPHALLEDALERLAPQVAAAGEVGLRVLPVLALAIVWKVALPVGEPEQRR